MTAALQPAVEVHIRAVGAADTEALIVLWREVFPEYADPTRPQRDARASIERKLAFGDGLFWLAAADGRIVGTAMAGYDGHRGWLYSLGVAPALRRRGVAGRLLDHAHGALAALGCPKINLHVLAGNTGGQAFWRAMGYTEDAVLSFGQRLPDAKMPANQPPASPR